MRSVAPYDRKARVYDAIVGHPLYTRMMWGVPRQRFTQFGAEALEHSRQRAFAEIGCGSLLFTSSLYQDSRASSIVLVDRSIRMLELARGRLTKGSGEPRPRLLHADAAKLPFAAGAFGAIVALNLLHVPCDRPAIVAECGRLLMPGEGKLFVSCLVRSGRGYDLPLRFFHRTGQLAPPITPEAMLQLLAGTWGHIDSVRYEGSMAFVVVRRNAD